MENYIDKSLMIEELEYISTNINKYICISRPRRFGKTIAQNMIAAFYSKGCDSREIFSNLMIGSNEKCMSNLNKYNVIHLDMNSEYQNTINKNELIKSISDKVKEEIIIDIPEVEILESDSLASTILKVYAAKKEQFIILIDEYDVLVRENVPQELFNEYLGFLNGLFKSNTLKPAIKLAYITGILPVVRDKVQSKLNNFDEYTFLDSDRLAKFVGFTNDEVQMLCKNYDLDFEECKRWYDGYNINGVDIYNPESVIKAVQKKRLDCFWGRTSSYAAISDRLNSQKDERIVSDVTKLLAGESIDVNVTRFMNTMDSFNTPSDLYTYLIHLGYLAYDLETGTCRIPNKEVRQEWFNAIEVVNDYSVTDEIIKESKTLLQATIDGNEDFVAKALDISHIHVTSNRSYNNEDALASAIYLAYIYALNKYSVFKEVTAGKGFADVIFVPFEENYPAMVIELKKDKSSESAIRQIKDKQYFDVLSHYSGNLIFVGINYSEESKTHSCSIERFVK